MERQAWTPWWTPVQCLSCHHTNSRWPRTIHTIPEHATALRHPQPDPSSKTGRNLFASPAEVGASQNQGIVRQVDAQSVMADGAAE